VSGPSDDVVRNAVATTAGVDLADVRLRRREPYEYASSAVLEEIVVSIGDTERELILKRLSWEGLFGDAVTSKQRWLHDPRREFGVYEMLAGMDVTPTLYGGSTDGDDAWMLVEKAGGVELWQVGELAVWEGVASWLAAFHVRFRGLVDELAERNPALIRYDRSWIERWTAWATEVVERVGDPRARELSAVASRYGDGVVEWAVHTPSVFVHGELYPSNVLVQGGRDDVVVRPIDWEMAGIGPGALDLAALVAGWDPPEREALIAAYERSMSQPDPELRRHVSLARLHLALRWLALTGDWRPPAEHARDWVAEALDSAADLDRHEGSTPPRRHGVTDARILVVNADDFGASEGVNAGIIEAHQHGIVTSASLMVRGAAVQAAAEYARTNGLSVGLHLDLGEWSYVDGEWKADYEVVDLKDREAVTREVRAQIDAFVTLVGRTPTHLDSHQHVHRDEPVRGALNDIGRELQIPVRSETDIVYNGSFYGQYGKGTPYPEAISVDAMVALIDGLADPVTEIACHPAAAVDFDTMYAAERLTELATLCDPRIREAIDRNGVILCGFGDLATLRAG
jgi:predicted glycoside hydrolase/deacetylase ChbG (UPF0249 family)/aminoglycoside phosphotransferase (APT) family kinase protein